MFSAALPLTVSVLFGASLAGHVYGLVAQRERWICTIERLLHIVMCTAMVVMAWPAGMELPTLGPIVFFLAAAVWFVLVTAHVCAGTAERLTNSYHALMMAAVAWLYAAMSDRLPGQRGHSADRTMSDSSGIEMPGMDISPPATAEHGWITTVDWIATVVFASAAAYWLYRYFAPRKMNSEPQPARRTELGPLCQALMACGMAIMFGAML